MRVHIVYNKGGVFWWQDSNGISLPLPEELMALDTSTLTEWMSLAAGERGPLSDWCHKPDEIAQKIAQALKPMLEPISKCSRGESSPPTIELPELFREALALPTQTMLVEDFMQRFGLNRVSRIKAFTIISYATPHF